MSNQQQNKVSSKASSKAASSKFCKVCYDAGKPVSEYSSHHVRNSIGGDVICPILLNQMCKYCKKQGHTPSHCPALKGKYNKDNSKHKQAEQHKQAELQKRATRLCESPPPPPCLNSNKYEEKNIVRPIALKNTWANVVTRPQKERAPSPEPAEQAEQDQEDQDQDQDQEQAQTPVDQDQDQEQAEQEPAEYKYVPVSYTSWADI